MSWGRRKHPYTDAGVRRLKCIRCSAPADSQWQVCADGNNYRPVCKACDIELNALVLSWMGHPDAVGAIKAYKGASA